MIEVKCIENDVSIKWFMIRYCNFNCPGCIEGINNEHIFSKEELHIQQKQAVSTGKKILDFIRSYEGKSIKLTITGGECSLLNLEEIFNDWNYIGVGNRLHIVMITNFSASNDKYKSFFSLLDKYGITHSMTASIHDNHWKNFDYIIKKIIEMKDYIGCVNYVITDDNKDLIVKYFHTLEPYVKQRIGVNRNGKVEYLVNDDIWDIIKSCNVKKQIKWTENGVKEKLDMDTMLNERMDSDGFYGWTCYPIIKIEPNGDARICKRQKVELNKFAIPSSIVCPKRGKCTPYNFIKCIKE